MKTAKVDFFTGKNKKWRWRLVASNGQVICTPGEDFANRRNARKNFETVRNALFGSVSVEGVVS